MRNHKCGCDCGGCASKKKRGQARPCPQLDVNAFVQQFVSALDAMNAPLVASFFAPDGTQTIGNGPTIVGRSAIEAATAFFFTLVAGISHQLVNITSGTDANGNLIVYAEARITYTRLDMTQVTVPSVSALRFNANCVLQDQRVFIDLTPVFAP